MVLRAACGLFLFAAGVPAAEQREMPGALRIAILADPTTHEADTRGLAQALAARLAAAPMVVRADPAAGGVSLSALQAADTVVIIGGPGAAIPAADVAAVDAVLRSRAGVVLIAVRAESWPEALRVNDVIGATAAGPFAGGAAPTVINLFPHPILTGIPALETTQPAMRFEKLADDAQIIIEGTVGEATAPIAWVRRTAGHRLCHLAMGTPAMFADPAYQQLIANAVLWSAGRPIPGAGPTVQRTFMPESYPGAFAITLPNGPGVCLDPVRGGISYVWDGDFVDLRPRWLTKQGEVARIFGDVYYRETAWQPWRAGSPNAEPQFRFRGYTLHPEYPEFHYEIGGREVHEILTASRDGGLIRRFRVGAGAPLWLRLEAQPGAAVTLRGVERDGDWACFPERAAGEFTIEVRRKSAVTP